MSTTPCRRFEHRHETDGVAWRDHLARCPECARQQRAHDLLRTTLDEARPRPSSDFHRRVVSEAMRRRRRRTRTFGSVWRRRLMAGYWLAAACASYLVLTLSWPEHLDPSDWVVVGGVALTLLLPALLLRSLLRTGLVELWFRTIE